MFCSQCGQKLLEGASFCTNCGMKIIYQEPDIAKEMIPEEPAAEDVNGFETREQIVEEAFANEAEAQNTEDAYSYGAEETPADSPLTFGADEQAAEEYEDYVFAGAASKEEYEAQQAREQAGAQPNNGQNAGYGYDNNQNQGYQPNYAGASRAAAIVGYITWIGFIVAIVIGDRNDPHTRFHTNQALVLNIAAIICGLIMIIPIIGWVIGIIGYILVIIGWFIGIIGAASGTMNRAPLFGKINLIG